MTEAERLLATQFRDRLRAALGDRFLGLRLFGSRARGVSRQDSDMDMAVLVVDADLKTRRDVAYLAADQMLQDESGITISPLVLDPKRVERLRRSERLLIRELDQDGIDI